MDGALMEVGPFRTQKDKLVANPGSWNKDANLLFVDQPVGVGLSTTDSDSYLHELPDMAKDIITFLEKYFEIFPEQITNDFYVAGESYAGQYLPYIADAILEHNKNITEGKQELPLNGVMIGNGWIDPKNQYPAYLPFAYEKGLIKQGSNAAAVLEGKQRDCLQALAEWQVDDQPVHNSVCEKILSTLLREMYLDTGLDKTDSNACVNMYDIRLHDTYSSCGMNWPPDLVTVTPYLRRDDVLAALNIPEAHRNSWTECNRGVSNAFKAKNSTASVPLIPKIIEQGVPVLMFNGDQDLICNSEGNERLIKALTWGGEEAPSSGFKSDEEAEDWLVNGTLAGVYQSARNLTYVKVFNASHMVPFDLPEVAQTLLNQFIGIPGYEVESQRHDAVEQNATNGNEEEHDDNSDSDESNDGDNEKDDKEAPKWHSHPLKAGAVLFLVILVGLFLMSIVKRNRSLVAQAGAINHRRRDSEPEIVRPSGGLVGMVLDRISAWRHGRSSASAAGFTKLSDEDDDLDVPLREVEEGRESLDSIESMLNDPERAPTRIV